MSYSDVVFLASMSRKCSCANTEGIPTGANLKNLGSVGSALGGPTRSDSVNSVCHTAHASFAQCLRTRACTVAVMRCAVISVCGITALVLPIRPTNSDVRNLRQAGAEAISIARGGRPAGSRRSWSAFTSKASARASGPRRARARAPRLAPALSASSRPHSADAL